MKNILHLFSVVILLLYSCEKNENISDIKKELTPESIKVIQDENKIDLKNIYQNDTIHLSQNKSYHIEIKFSEGVKLIEGKFLKFKNEGNGLFSADFYGKNTIEIQEEVIFRKEGYSDWKLNIKQKPLIPNYVISLKGVGESNDNNFLLDKKSNVIAITNTSESKENGFPNYQLQLKFPSDVFIENVGSNDDRDFISVDKLNNVEYRLTIKSSKLYTEKNYTIKLPIYNFSNHNKGAKIGEIIFKGDFRPYIDRQEYAYRAFDFNQTINYIRKQNYRFPWFPSNIIIPEFKIQGKKANAIIENLNEEYLEDLTYDKSEGWSMNLKEDKKQLDIKKPVKAFDLYEAEIVAGELVKKVDTPRREIYLLSTE